MRKLPVLGAALLSGLLAQPAGAAAEEAARLRPMIGETAAEFASRAARGSPPQFSGASAAEAPSTPTGARLVPFVGETASEFEARRSGGPARPFSPDPILRERSPALRVATPS